MQKRIPELDSNDLRAPVSHALLCALRAQIRKDTYGERSALFRSLLGQKPLARLVFSVLDCSLILKVFTCALFAHCRAQARIPTGKFHVAIVGTRGEKLAFDRLTTALPHQNILEVSYGSSIAALARIPAAPLRFARLFWRLNKKYPFFVCLRAAETVGFYGFLVKKWRSEKAASVTVFSEGNPHGLGAMAAAHACFIPVVYVAHAPIVTNPSRLNVHLAVFYGPSAEADFRAVGSAMKKVLLYGWISPQTTQSSRGLCISLSKDVSLSFLRELLEAPNKANSVIVRLHPNSLIPEKVISSALPAHAELSFGRSLEHDLSRTAVHIAGNSTVHLESLARGVPSYYLPELDNTKDFPISAIRAKMVPSISRNTLQEILLRPASQPVLPIGDFFETEISFEEFSRLLQTHFPAGAS